MSGGATPVDFMGMAQPRTKVLVATEPLAFGSALRAALALDPRLDVLPVTAATNGDFEALARTAAVILVTDTVPELPATVIRLHDSSPTVEIHRGGRVVTRPYEGMAWLIELVATCVAEDVTTLETSPAQKANSQAPDRAAGAGEVVAG